MLHLAFLLVLPAQADAAKLVEKLGSDSLEEREEATRALKTLGKPALPALERAAKSPDLEVAARAERLLRVIPFAEHLTDRVLALMPGVEDRLRMGDGHTWTEVYLDSLAIEGLSSGDFGAMIAKALDGARSSGEIRRICHAAERMKMKSVSGELSRVLRHESADARADAVRVLGTLGSVEHTAVIASLLEDRYLYVRLNAAWALAFFEAREHAPRIARLLSDPQEAVREQAARALCWLGAKEGAPLVLQKQRTLGDLNGVRRPEAWKRLTRRWALQPEGNLMESIERMLGLEKMTVEWPKPRTALEEGLLAGEPRLKMNVELRVGTLVADLLDPVAELIVDDDRVRILWKDEALNFWKGWWDEEQRRR
jgi:hypothetical protein